MTGRCNICGWEGTFLHPELSREGNLCGNCSASSRHRMVIYALAAVFGLEDTPMYAWPNARQIRILESSARGSYPSILGDKFDYYGTEYDPGKIAQGTDPRSYADFQKLHYEDGSFDVVIASDVFEHVRQDEAGYREINRVLKPGGILILTVPYDHHRQETVQRVDTSGEEDVHLLEPEFHGGGGHTLTYRNYGRDLLSLLHRCGFAVGHLEKEIPWLGIPRQSIILASKGEYIELPAISGRPMRNGSLGPLAPFRFFLLVKYNIKGFIHYWKEWRRK
jgi:SAM-dependent methyltransferase